MKATYKNHTINVIRYGRTYLSTGRVIYTITDKVSGELVLKDHYSGTKTIKELVGDVKDIVDERIESNERIS